MNPIRAIGRPARILAALAAAALASPLRPPPPRPPGWNKHPPLPAHAHTIAAGGMPGWQIALLTAAGALLAAAIAMTIYRVRAARQRPTTAAA